MAFPMLYASPSVVDYDEKVEIGRTVLRTILKNTVQRNKDGTLNVSLPKVGVTKIIVDEDCAEIISLLSLHSASVTSIENAEKLVALRNVDCSGCGFESVPPWIELLPAVEYVRLPFNRLKEIPEGWFAKIPTLKEVDLLYNKELTSLPDLHVSSALTKLVASGCSLKSLPENLFHFQLHFLDVAGNKELRQLPKLLPKSKITYLNASYCGLETIDPSLVKSDIELILNDNNIKDLPAEFVAAFVNDEEGACPSLHVENVDMDFYGNQIEKLPRKQLINYLKAVEKFRDHIVIISLNNNPLSYPPEYIYIQGEEETRKFLQLFSPDEVDKSQNEMSVMLMGDTEEGKSSFGRSLEKNEPRAGDFKKEDRTEAFDTYACDIGQYHVHITDLGGQDDYNLVLPLLSRNRGLFFLIVSCPSLLGDMKQKALQSLGRWIQKVREAVVGAHVMIVLTKTDVIESSGDEIAKRQQVAVCMKATRDYLRKLERETQQKYDLLSGDLQKKMASLESLFDEENVENTIYKTQVDNLNRIITQQPTLYYDEMMAISSETEEVYVQHKGTKIKCEEEHSLQDDNGKLEGKNKVEKSEEKSRNRALENLENNKFKDDIDVRLMEGDESSRLVRVDYRKAKDIINEILERQVKVALPKKWKRVYERAVKNRKNNYFITFQEVVGEMKLYRGGQLDNEDKESGLNEDVENHDGKAVNAKTAPAGSVVKTLALNKAGKETEIKSAIPMTAEPAIKTKLKSHSDFDAETDEANVDADFDAMWESKKLLEGYRAMGLMVWSDKCGDVGFHDVKKLASLMKSVFSHRMQSIVKKYAQQRWQGDKKRQRRASQLQSMGKIPLSLVRHIFIKHLENPTLNVAIAHKETSFFLEVEIKEDTKRAFSVFLSTLRRTNTLIVIRDSELEDEVCVIPALAKVSAESVDRSASDLSGNLVIACKTQGYFQSLNENERDHEGNDKDVEEDEDKEDVEDEDKEDEEDEDEDDGNSEEDSGKSVGRSLVWNAQVSSNLFSQVSVNFIETGIELAKLGGFDQTVECYLNRQILQFGPFRVQIDHVDDGIVISSSLTKDWNNHAEWLILLFALNGLRELLLTVHTEISVMCRVGKNLEKKHCILAWNDDSRTKRAFECLLARECECQVERPSNLIEKIFEKERCQSMFSDKNKGEYIAMKNLLEVILSEDTLPTEDAILDEDTGHPAILSDKENMDWIEVFHTKFVDDKFPSKSAYQEYAQNFENLERNRFLVTNKADWKEDTEAWRAKYAVKELKNQNSRTNTETSVRCLLSEIRNIWCHKSKPGPLAKDINEKMPYFVMHCFTARERMKSADGHLRVFGDAHDKKETEECRKIIQNTSLQQPKHLFTKVLIDKELLLSLFSDCENVEIEPVAQIGFWSYEDGLRKQALGRLGQKKSNAEKSAEQGSEKNVKQADEKPTEFLVLFEYHHENGKTVKLLNQGVKTFAQLKELLDNEGKKNDEQFLLDPNATHVFYLKEDTVAKEKAVAKSDKARKKDV